jgi:hypothetical protein
MISSEEVGLGERDALRWRRRCWRGVFGRSDEGSELRRRCDLLRVRVEDGERGAKVIYLLCGSSVGETAREEAADVDGVIIPAAGEFVSKCRQPHH